MKILAIDSSGMPASAAVAEDGVLLAEYTVHYKKTHSQTLLPMLDQVRSMLELDLETVDAVAVAGGPGSFTGLRIGSATAKGIALALDKPVVSVPTLEALAYNVYGTDGIVVPMMDARRGQVFTGIYAFREDAEDPLEVLVDQAPADVGELCGKVNELCEESGRRAVLLGDGTVSCRDVIVQTLRVPYRFVPAHLNEQKAGSAAVRAMDLMRLGRVQTAAEHRPEYLRVSQAERVRAEKLHGQ